MAGSVFNSGEGWQVVASVYWTSPLLNIYTVSHSFNYYLSLLLSLLLLLLVMFLNGMARLGNIRERTFTKTSQQFWNQCLGTRLSAFVRTGLRKHKCGLLRLLMALNSYCLCVSLVKKAEVLYSLARVCMSGWANTM